MDFEGLAELLVPLAFLAIVGGLVALRMLKPYGDRILELIREIQEDRHQALSETRDLQALRDRMDMLAERQDFLETLVERRLDESEQAELERIRREEIDPSAGLKPPDLASASGDRGGGRRPGEEDPPGRVGGGEAGTADRPAGPDADEDAGGDPSRRSPEASGGGSGS